LDLDPANEYRWFCLGGSYWAAGRVDDAIAAFEKAVKLTPGHAEAWQSLGSCYEKAGRTDDAAAAFEKARKLKAEPPRK
jgi:Flp pilus assembly protein TadD